MTFSDKLSAAQKKANSWLCVGLDTDPDKIPPALRGRGDAVVAFNREIIQATRDLVSAYKPNLAFYLAQGRPGMDALAETVEAIPRDIPVILDAKFGDIESSSQGYARFAFDTLGVDAVTVNPYLGADSIAPFLEYADHAIFLLAHTSNPGARELQDAFVVVDTLEPTTEELYLRVAQSAKALRGKAEVALVVGATFPDQLRQVRQANPSAIFLVPGIGAQGGSLAEAVEFGPNGAGVGPIINGSRAILYASSADDYADAARSAATRLRDQIRQVKR